MIVVMAVVVMEGVMNESSDYRECSINGGFYNVVGGGVVSVFRSVIESSTG